MSHFFIQVYLQGSSSLLAIIDLFMVCFQVLHFWIQFSEYLLRFQFFVLVFIPMELFILFSQHFILEEQEFIQLFLVVGSEHLHFCLREVLEFIFNIEVQVFIQLIPEERQYAVIFLLVLVEQARSSFLIELQVSRLLSPLSSQLFKHFFPISFQLFFSLMMQIFF